MLLWTKLWEEQGIGPDWDLGQGSRPFARCPVSNCHITVNWDNNDDSRVPDYDALLFHSWQLFHTDNFVLPSRRSGRQKYILASIEPIHYCAYLTDWEYKVMIDD